MLLRASTQARARVDITIMRMRASFRLQFFTRHDKFVERTRKALRECVMDAAADVRMRAYDESSLTLTLHVPRRPR